MKLTTIAAKALKGQTFTHALGAVTLITGANDTGKTARADAVRLALLGYLPEHGKTGPSTFALSGATKLVVEAQIDGMPTVRREWTKTGKTVKASSTGTDELPETPLVLLNAGEYFWKSDAGKVNMLFDVLNLDAEQWSIEKLAEHVMEATGLVGGPVQADMAKILKAQGSETVQQWLDRVAEDLADNLKRTKAEVDRYTETAQGITALGQNETPVDPDRVAADKQAALKKLESLRTESGRLKAIVEQQGRGAQRRAELQRDIAGHKAALGDRPLPEAAAAETLEALQTAQRELATVQEKHRAAVEAAQKAIRAAKRADELRDLINRYAGAIDQLPAFRASAEKLKADREALGADLVEQRAKSMMEANSALAGVRAKQKDVEARKLVAIARRDDLMQRACCPTCGAPGKEFKPAVEELHRAAMEDIANSEAAVAHEYQEAKSEMEAASNAYNEALAKQKRAQSLERMLGEVEQQIRTAEAAVTQRENAQRELENIGDTSGRAPDAPLELQTLTRRVAELGDDLNRLHIAEKLKALETELQSTRIDGDEEADQRLAQIEDDIEAQREHIAALQQREKQAANQSADQKRLAEAQVARQTMEQKAEVLAKARKAVASERAGLIDATFGPLLERVNVFTQGILETPLEYREGELGRFVGPSWVPVRCFGGTHQAVTYAGIQAALGSGAPARLVIVDEMGRFDRKNKGLFMRNVQMAIKSGLIDQFLGCDVSAEHYQGIDGLTLLSVG